MRISTFAYLCATHTANCASGTPLHAGIFCSVLPTEEVIIPGMWISRFSDLNAVVSTGNTRRAPFEIVRKYRIRKISYLGCAKKVVIPSIWVRRLQPLDAIHAWYRPCTRPQQQEGWCGGNTQVVIIPSMRISTFAYLCAIHATNWAGGTPPHTGIFCSVLPAEKVIIPGMWISRF